MQDEVNAGEVTKDEEVTLDLSTGGEFLFPIDKCKSCLGRGYVKGLPPNKVESEVVKYNKKGGVSVRAQVNPLETWPCECLTKVLRKEIKNNPESAFKGGKYKQIFDTYSERQILVIGEALKEAIVGEIPEETE